MPPQAPWSPTAHAFAQHQFSQVANFWKQGRPASFQLEALPGGHARLNLTFQLPQASEVVPPPSHVFPVPAPQRRIHPLFPRGCFSQDSGAFSKTTPSPQKNFSSKQRKSFRRSVLHRAALAAPSLPPPVNGSLRQAAQACVQRLKAVNIQNASVASSLAVASAASSLATATVMSPLATVPVMSPHPATAPMATFPTSTPVSRRPPCCTSCRQPVKGHKGPLGSRCPAPESMRGSESNLSLNASLGLEEEGRAITCLNCEHPLTPTHQCEEVFNISQEDFHSETDVDKSSSELSFEARGEYKTECSASDLGNQVGENMCTCNCPLPICCVCLHSIDCTCYKDNPDSSICSCEAHC